MPGTDAHQVVVAGGLPHRLLLLAHARIDPPVPVDILYANMVAQAKGPRLDVGGDTATLSAVVRNAIVGGDLETPDSSDARAADVDSAAVEELPGSRFTVGGLGVAPRGTLNGQHLLSKSLQLTWYVLSIMPTY
jgi:hypothetical protein